MRLLLHLMLCDFCCTCTRPVGTVHAHSMAMACTPKLMHKHTPRGRMMHPHAFF